MIERGKELGDVEGNNTRLEAFCPTHTHDGGKDKASIFSGSLDHTTELVGMKDPKLDSVNWSQLAIIFSMSFPKVLRRTIGWNAFRVKYKSFPGLGMITKLDSLK